MQALVLGCALLLAAGALCAQPNRLSTREKAEGWQLLFDGKTSQHWLEVAGRPFPTNSWVIEDGWLKARPKDGGLQDLRTVKEFRNFELTWEWRCEATSNSGVKYLLLSVDPGKEGSGDPHARGRGFEYQLGGAEGDRKAKDDARYAPGALYGIYAPRPVARPAAEIHQSRLLVRGDHVEHWLDGEKIVEFVLSSPDLAPLEKRRPFPARTAWDSPIVLQNHRSQFWYRNIKVRRLPAAAETAQ